MLLQRCLLSVSLIFVGIVTSASARAEMLVISSNSRDFREGGELKETTSIVLEKNVQIRVMNKDTGETRTLIGPYTGPLNEYKAPPCTAGGQLSLNCGLRERSKVPSAARGVR
jgi:hypothetical protein